MRKLITAIVFVGILAGAAIMYGRWGSSAPASNFMTVEVKRDDLLVTVDATGPVAPEEVVDIGAQVVGRISELGVDPRAEFESEFKDKNIDYCSPVKKGMVLAKIDPSVYQAQYDQAVAAVARAKADLLQLQAKAVQTQAEWVRAQKLRELKLPSLSPTGLDTASVSIRGISDADFIMAEANSKMATASVAVGEATVMQQESTLKLAKTNLDYTVIMSPVDGTIIERRVNIGQTVVSSMNAPSLFLIAEDLRRMQVWTYVNEADIGRLKIGMPVQFTVDAFPDDVFRGEVYQIRLNAKSDQNVVLYTVVVRVENRDLKLLPYLTANVKFEVERHPNVLIVPNAALRYRPNPAQISPAAAREEEKEPSGKREEGSPDKRGRGRKKADKSENEGVVWVKDGDFVSPIDVQVGASSGGFTAISGTGIEDGTEVVTGLKKPEAPTEAVNNPFAPPRFRGGGGGRR